MPWQAVDSRAKGAKHLAGGLPCQDYSAYRHLSEKHIIGAISDGMGSARHSDLGSMIAVETAISELSQVDWQSLQRDASQYTQNIFNSVLEAVRCEISNQADSHGYLIQDLACTLIVFSATPDRLIAMQVGDGLLVVRAEGGDYELLFKPDKGEFANETTSVTSTNAQYEMKVDQTKPYQFICAATDGIENISLIKLEGWKPSPNFFRPLEQHILSKDNDIQKKEKLEAFLNSDKINQNTDDDKTILLCAYTNCFFHTAQGEQTRNIPDSINLISTKKEEKEILEKEKSTKDSSSLANDSVARSSQQKRLSKQETKLIESKITSALNQSNYCGLSPKLAESKKPGCLGIWLPSDKELPDRRRIVRIIRKEVNALKNSHIRRIKIFNCFPDCFPEKNKVYTTSLAEQSAIPVNGTSIKKVHWIESFDLETSFTLIKYFLIILVICGLVLTILYILVYIIMFLFSL